MSTQDLIYMLAIGGVVVMIMIVAELLNRFTALPAEVTRKIVHLGVGLTALPLPFLFRSHWPVLILTASMFFLLVASSKMKTFGAVHGVERKSVGAFVYPASVYFLFVLSKGNHLFFQVPILILLFSDTLAALVGQFYGQIRYEVGKGRRTLEGSVVFFIAAFLLAHIPILLSGETTREQSLLIALLLAVLVTGFEATSTYGWDNLYIPFGSFFILQRLITVPTIELLQTTMAVVLVGLLCFIPYTFRRLTVAGTIGIFLIGMIFWILGGIWWILPSILAYLTYRIFSYPSKLPPRSHADRYPMRLILQFNFASVLIVFAYAYTGNESYYAAFLVSFSAQFSILLVSFYDAGKDIPYLDRTTLTPGHLWIAFTGALVPSVFLYLRGGQSAAVVPRTIAIMALMGTVAFVLQRLYTRWPQVKYRCAACGLVSDRKSHCEMPTTYLQGIPAMSHGLGALLSTTTAVVLWFGVTRLLGD